MKKRISLLLALVLMLGCLPALGEGFAADYAAMNEAAASVLILTMYDKPANKKSSSKMDLEEEKYAGSR